MIDNPIVRLDGQRLLVIDMRRHHPGAALSFWGVVVMLGVVIAMLLIPSWRQWSEPSGLVVPLMTFAVGTVLLMIGGRPRLREVMLAEVALEDRQLTVWPAASSLLEGKARRLWLDEIDTLLYGLTRFPLEREGGVEVEAYTVCLRLFDGAIIPVVEATVDKKVALDVASALSRALEIPVEQVGIGMA